MPSEARSAWFFPSDAENSAAEAAQGPQLPRSAVECHCEQIAARLNGDRSAERMARLSFWRADSEESATAARRCACKERLRNEDVCSQGGLHNCLDDCKAEDLMSCDAATTICSDCSVSLSLSQPPARGDSPTVESCRVYFLDWDDTLFPSSLLLEIAGRVEARSRTRNGARRNAATEGRRRFPPFSQWTTLERVEFRMIEQNVLDFLQSLDVRRGAVFVVTSATQRWVQCCCSNYYPGVAAFLRNHGVSVMSVHDAHRGAGVNADLAKYKTCVFFTALQAAQAHCKPDVVFNVGDQRCEQIALVNCAKLFPLIKCFINVEIPKKITTARQFQVVMSRSSQLISPGTDT